MTDEYWSSAYKNKEFKHWELNYPSPELVTLVAVGILKKDFKILDVGCGGGLDAIFLARCGLSVMGTDISPTALGIASARAKKANVEVEWLLGNVLDLPVKNESMDLVTDRGLFHVIEDVDRPRYSSELYRVLRDNGLALIRGAEKRFNPVTGEAVGRFFSPNFEIGPVLPIPLFSTAGVIDGRIVLLRKRENEQTFESQTH